MYGNKEIQLILLSLNSLKNYWNDWIISRNPCNSFEFLGGVYETIFESFCGEDKSLTYFLDEYCGGIPRDICMRNSLWKPWWIPEEISVGISEESLNESLVEFVEYSLEEFRVSLVFFFEGSLKGITGIRGEVLWNLSYFLATWS